MADRREALARIQGFLAALEAANTYADNCPTFSITDLPAGTDLAPRVRQHLIASGVVSVATSEIADWKSELQRIGPTWFGGVRPQSVGSICDRLSALLDALFEGTATVASSVSLTFAPGAPFYEASWVDIVFSAGLDAYLLHLGVSD